MSKGTKLCCAGPALSQKLPGTTGQLLFFFIDPAPPEIYPLPLRGPLPLFPVPGARDLPLPPAGLRRRPREVDGAHRRRGAPDPQREHAPAGTAGGSGPCETRSVAACRMGAPAARVGVVRGTPDVSGDPRRHSREILDGPERAAAPAYLKGVGYADEAPKRTIIGAS